MVTSSYKNFSLDLYKRTSISGDRGKNAGYTGACYPKLAPKMSFWKIWHDNIGVISEEENNKYYVEEYYKQVLSKLDPQLVYNDLKYDVLLCYEEGTEFCHRHLVAEWLNLLLDVEIPEIKCNGNGFEFVERPSYIKQFLEEAMRKDRNMRGFTSLRSLYLFEESERIEREANELEEKTGKCYDGYRQLACYIRCDADEAESKYKAIQKMKNKK